ncbi:CoA transferase subunit A [Desulfosporosinus fructosivorans]
MHKIYAREEVLKKFTDGQRIMIGGFASRGVPDNLIDLLVESGAKNLTIISADTGQSGIGVGKLVSSKQMNRAIISHVGKNPDTGRAASTGELEVEFSPQGNLAERIRCGGTGLGGVLVTTGLGTVIEQGKQKVVVAGKTYLLETPLHADIALVKAWKADTMGNLVYRGTSRNFNPLVAMAADLVIVDTEEIVPIGTIDPNHVVTPGLLVHMILAR